MVTQTVVREGQVGTKRGFVFDVYFNDRKYPNVVSALYKTQRGAQRKLAEYLRTGKLGLYGNAE
jgi:hypothetical protein